MDTDAILKRLRENAQVGNSVRLTAEEIRVVLALLDANAIPERPIRARRAAK